MTHRGCLLHKNTCQTEDKNGVSELFRLAIRPENTIQIWTFQTVEFLQSCVRYSVAPMQKRTSAQDLTRCRQMSSDTTLLCVALYDGVVQMRIAGRKLRLHNGAMKPGPVCVGHHCE